MNGRYGIIKKSLKSRKHIVCVFQDLEELKRVLPIIRRLIKENWEYIIDSYEDRLLSEMAFVSMKINNIFVILLTRTQYDCHPPEDIGPYILAILHPNERGTSS